MKRQHTQIRIHLSSKKLLDHMAAAEGESVVRVLDRIVQATHKPPKAIAIDNRQSTHASLWRSTLERLDLLAKLTKLPRTDVLNGIVREYTKKHAV